MSSCTSLWTIAEPSTQSVTQHAALELPRERSDTPEQRPLFQAVSNLCILKSLFSHFCSDFRDSSAGVSFKCPWDCSACEKRKLQRFDSTRCEIRSIRRLSSAMFEQDVAGLIKALRASKDDKVVIERALEETRKEIKSKDLEVKAAAILKLVYVSRAAPVVRVRWTDCVYAATARNARVFDSVCVVCDRRVHVLRQIPHQDDRLPRSVAVLRPRD